MTQDDALARGLCVAYIIMLMCTVTQVTHVPSWTPFGGCSGLPYNSHSENNSDNCSQNNLPPVKMTTPMTHSVLRRVQPLSSRLEASRPSRHTRPTCTNGMCAHTDGDILVVLHGKHLNVCT
jgi:hypothetical protein